MPYISKLSTPQCREIFPGLLRLTQSWHSSRRMNHRCMLIWDEHMRKTKSPGKRLKVFFKQLSAIRNTLLHSFGWEVCTPDNWIRQTHLKLSIGLTQSIRQWETLRGKRKFRFS